MRKRLLVLLSALMVLSTVFFAVNTTGFSAQATTLKPATLTFDSFDVGYTLPDERTSNFETSIDQSFGGFFTVFNNKTDTATTEVKQDVDGSKYLEFKNTKDGYGIVTAWTGSSIPAGVTIKIKLVIRPTGGTFVASNEKPFFIRTMNASSVINTYNIPKDTLGVTKSGSDYTVNGFSGSEWKTLEYEYTTNATKIAQSVRFYQYGRSGNGLDVKSVEILLVNDPKAPVFENTNYTYDCAGSDDLQIKVDTKGAFIEGLLLDKEDGNNPIFVTRDAYQTSSDNQYLIITADYLNKLPNGTNKFILQVNEVLYPFEVVISNSPIGGTPDAPDAPDTPVDDDKGCGSVIAGASAVLATVLLAGSIVVFKKKD
ncbi:MAG: hypothetical protein IKC71_00015 [Clostridia bacterium]|nr:hypothetical protein [Clostridia bacterium]